jgi:uncharacterized protein (UPF0332 family)
MKSNPLLEKAKRSLQVAEEILASGNPDFAASRVYYAYLYTAQALLATKGLEFSRHGQVIAQYGRHFSKTSTLDPRFHKAIGTAFEIRQLGDYEAEVSIDPERALSGGPVPAFWRSLGVGAGPLSPLRQSAGRRSASAGARSPAAIRGY